MKRIGAILTFAVLSSLPTVTHSTASTLLIDNPAYAQDGSVTTTPVGAYQFCLAHASECGPDMPVAAHIDLTESLWTEMIAVNDGINVHVAPETDEAQYGREEYWTYPTTAGDCEDYVLAKRRALLDVGLPASALLIAVVRRPDGEGHAVLMVRTDRGDLVLDNLVGTISVWDQTPYRYVKRQSALDAGRWVSVEDSRVLLVTR